MDSGVWHQGEPSPSSWPARAGKGTLLVSADRPRASQRGCWGGVLCLDSQAARMLVTPHPADVWGHPSKDGSSPDPALGSAVEGPGSCQAGRHAPLLDIVTQGPLDTKCQVTGCHKPRDLGGEHIPGAQASRLACGDREQWAMGAHRPPPGSAPGAGHLPTCLWLWCLCACCDHPPPPQSLSQPLPGDWRHQLSWRGCWSLRSLGPCGRPAQRALQEGLAAEVW